MDAEQGGVNFREVAFMMSFCGFAVVAVLASTLPSFCLCCKIQWFTYGVVSEGFFAEISVDILRKFDCLQTLQKIVLLRQGKVRKFRRTFQTNFCNDPFPNDSTSELLKIQDQEATMTALAVMVVSVMTATLLNLGPLFRDLETRLHTVQSKMIADRQISS